MVAVLFNGTSWKLSLLYTHFISWSIIYLFCFIIFLFTLHWNSCNIIWVMNVAKRYKGNGSEM